MDPNAGLGKYMTLYPPCFYCIHLIETGDQHSHERWTCKAFPSGVPYHIWARHQSHTKPLPKGLQVGSFVYESEVFETDDGKQRITFDGEWVNV